MKKLLPLIALLFLSLRLSAGNSVMFVNGTVTDKTTNETLAGVEVRVKGTAIVVYTDFDGHFYLPDLPAGAYELEFRYLTYSSTQAVTDNCDHCTSLAVEMSAR